MITEREANEVIRTIIGSTGNAEELLTKVGLTFWQIGWDAASTHLGTVIEDSQPIVLPEPILDDGLDVSEEELKSVQKSKIEPELNVLP